MPANEFEALCSGRRKEERLLVLETVENMDNNSFWDPDSIDTLIFNSYVGGACIFEYYNDRIELIRATEKFMQIIGSSSADITEILKLDWNRYLEENSRRAFLNDIAESIKTNREITGEYLYIGLPNCPNETYLRSTIRIVASAGNRYLIYSINENITAQREAEKKEQLLTQQLQSVMNNSNAGISAIYIDGNGKGHLVFANDKYYSMFGYTKEQFDIEIDYVSQLIHPDDIAESRKQIMEIFKTHVPREMKYRCVKRDGSVIHVHGSKSIARVDGIDYDILISVITDITELIEAEMRARKASDQLQAIMDNVDLGITASLVKNGNAEFMFANDRYYAMLGYTREQFLAEVQNAFTTVAPEDRQMLFEQTEMINRTGKSAMLEFKVICRNGEQRFFRSHISLGHFAGIDSPVQLAIYRDITALRKSQMKERSATERLTAILSGVRNGITAAILNDSNEVELIFANDRYFEIMGYTREQYRTEVENPFDIIHPDDRDNVIKTSYAAYEKQAPAKLEYRIIRRDKSIVWIRADISSAHFSDYEQNVNLCTFTDITMEKEVERELLDNLPCGAALYEYDGEKISILHLNKRYWQWVNRVELDPSELSIEHSIHPDDIETIPQELKSAIRHGRDFVRDIRVLYGKDEYKLFHVVGRIVKKSDGVYSIYATYTHLSSREIIYQQMFPAVLSTIMDATTDLSFGKDEGFRYICASRKFIEMVGLEGENDLIGKTDYDLFDKEVADKFRRDDERLMKSGKSMVDVVEAIPSADGNPRFSSTSKYLIRDTRGKIVGLYGIGRDITQYRDAYAKLALLTSSIPGGLATYSCDENELSLKTVSITYCNDGFCRLFGITREENETPGTTDFSEMIFKGDRRQLAEQHLSLIKYNTPIDCTYRLRTKDGCVKWISHKAVAIERQHGKAFINAILQDITEHMNLLERLRISEDEKQIAITLGGNVVSHFDIRNKTLTLSPETAKEFGLPEVIFNVPEEPIRMGMISPDTAGTYRDFFELISRGDKTVEVLFEQKYMDEWRWMKARSSTIFLDDNTPVKAVISFTDVTEQLEKENVYIRWQQSLVEKPADQYTLFRCNLSKDASFDTVEGSLLKVNFNQKVLDFNGRTKEYVNQCVFDEDKEKYTEFLNSDALLAGYYREKRSRTLEYREKLPNGETRWLRLLIDLVEYPNSSEIEAFLMYENIDEAKRIEQETKELVENDHLTGVLNRATFAARVNSIISSGDEHSCHAMYMMDIDNFKNVNDTLGHKVGDELLTEVANGLRASVRSSDFVGRLGGDEFMVFLCNINDKNAMEKKARTICSTVKKSLDKGVEISGSVGIAVAPQDGTDFETLYKNADEALYYIKRSSKDGYIFYSGIPAKDLKD